MKQYDWTQFKCRINVKAKPMEAYNAWATPMALETWFLRKAIFHSADAQPVKPDSFLKPGDRYEWYWFGYPDTTVERGEILLANRQDHIRFTFGEPCLVDVTIKEEQGETLIDLVQSAIPADEASIVKWHIGCLSGWTFYLANLKSILEGGIDLRNKNEALSGMMNS